MAIINSMNIRLRFSLLSTNNSVPLSPPEVDQTAMLIEGEFLQIRQRYYIHLPVGVSVMLGIEASQFYSGSREYSSVFLQSIRPNSCDFIQPAISFYSMNCKQELILCGYRLEKNWEDTSTYTWVTSEHIQMSMTWSGSNYLQSKYTYLHNLALTPYINSERFVLLTFELEFTVDSDTIASGGDLRLDVYRLSSLGLLTSKLASYYSGQNGLDELCLPTGRFQLAFLAYSDLCCASSKIQLSELQLTETECAPPTQTSYLCADDNVCLSRVMSLSPQFVWKYSMGKFTKIEGEDVLIAVYDLDGSINLRNIDTDTTIYLNAPGPFDVTLQVSIATDKRGCSNYSSISSDIGVRRENGQLLDLLNSSLATPSLWYSTDVLDVYLKADVARCVDLFIYHVNQTDSAQGYSLLLVRNSGSYLTDSDNLTSRWTSDVFSVADTSVCLAVDLVLPSLVQAKLFQVSLNGTGWNQSVFLSGSVTNERIRGVIQMSLDSDASQIQIALFFNENATIHNISLEFGSCHRNGSSPNTNLSCDFTNFDTCGYYDASEKESRWMATASSQVDPTGVGRQRECVSDADGRSYVGRQNVTFGGRRCLPWDSQEYVVHPYDDVSYFPDSSVESEQTGAAEVLLEDVRNFCRNPNFDGTYEIWPWCYGDGANYRKEYCPIPFCQVFFMKAVFGQSLDSAVLLTPPTRFNGPVCVQFQYRLTHPNIILSVQTIDLFNLSLSEQKFLELIYRLQTNISDWNSANVQLNGIDDEVQQVAFVAEKVGFTSELEYAAIRSIAINDSLCPGPETNKDQQELKEEYTGNRLPTKSYKQLVLDDFSQYNMGDIITMLGQQQHRLIYACKWNGVQCSDADIQSELTELGLCYTFNGQDDHILSSNNTGSKFGLSLLLNVEQYDNAPISSQNNGIKVHLRNYDDVPQVQDSGFDVAPGYKTLAPLDYLTVENLAAPWGRCSSTNYEFFSSTDRYTTAKCQIECQTRSVMATCRCKDYYMPGPGEVCSLGGYLYCVGSWKDQGPCNCPDECLVFSYTTALSFSQVSGSVIANGLWNTDSIRENYWHSLEITNRVDDAKRMLTVSGLKSVVDSQIQLTTLIYRTIVNPDTAMINPVSEAVGKLMDIVGTDVESSQLFLDNYQVSYKKNMAYFVQNLSIELSYSSQQIANWLNPKSLSTHHYPQPFYLLKNLTAMIKSTLSSAKDSLTDTANLYNSCSSFIHPIYDRIDKIEAEIDLLLTKCWLWGYCNKVEIYDYIIAHLTDLQLSISEVISCITKYEDLLSKFQSFLDSVDRTVSSVDISVATRSMNTLLMDGSWMEILMVGYQNGSRTKRSLSDVFLRESSNSLLLNVNNAVSGVELSVLSLLSSTISTIETRTISIYCQLIMYLHQMQTFMPVEDTAANNFSRQLRMFKSLFPMLLDKTNSNQMEQTLGAGVTIAALANRSTTLVPILVRAYTNSLKQTLSFVQSEVRSAQQVVVKSVSALSQQLTTFNDSTVIGDSFVSNNFLQIDIFYRELKYRNINQTTGYDIVQFLSDFGGCFGLFLGGSILSFFEFLDLLIYNFLVKMSDRKNLQLPTRVNVRPAPGVKDLRPKSKFQVHPLTETESSFGHSSA